MARGLIFLGGILTASALAVRQYFFGEPARAPRGVRAIARFRVTDGTHLRELAREIGEALPHLPDPITQGPANYPKQVAWALALIDGDRVRPFLLTFQRVDPSKRAQSECELELRGGNPAPWGPSREDYQRVLRGLHDVIRRMPKLQDVRWTSDRETWEAEPS